MRLIEIVEKMELTLLNSSAGLDLEGEVTKGYASDLLSDVIAHAEEGSVWITLQVHLNIVAVASMKDLAAIVLTEGRKPMKEVLEKASLEKVPIYMSDLPAFELIGRLYGMGIPGI